MMGVSSCNTMSQEPSAVRGLAFAVMVREVPHREAQRRQALDRGHPARRRVSGGAAGHHLTAGREAVAGHGQPGVRATAVDPPLGASLG
jgi:hypothetical protein